MAAKGYGVRWRSPDRLPAEYARLKQLISPEEPRMHPIAYSAAYEGEDRNRMTTFFRLIVAIPWFIVLTFYAIGAFFATIAAWFALAFTGRYPEGLYNFNAGFLRQSSRVSGFTMLLTDAWPPFGGEEGTDYPVRVLVEPPKDEYSMQALIQVVAVVAWLVIVLTGKLPLGLYRPLRIASAYTTKATAYGMLMTEDFPPFWQDEEEEAPRFGRSGPGVSAEPTTSLGL
jgi:hypothetical protein